MSLYQPTASPAAALDILQGPYFGGEFGVYLSEVPAKHIGTIEYSAEATAVYSDNGTTVITTGGKHLQVVARTPIVTDADVVITLACMDDTGTPIAMNGVATFTAPNYVRNQGVNFPRHHAVDLVPAVGGKKFTSITGSGHTFTNGQAGMIFDVFELPEFTAYSIVPCTTEIAFTTKGRMAKGVDCGLEADAFVKRGKSKPGNLTIGAKMFSMLDGLMRFDGSKCTVMLVGVKDGLYTGDRLVFTQWVPTIENRLPEGDGEATAGATEGKYVDLLMFPAYDYV